MVEVVTAALVKELRERTGAGMMDCKRALDDTKGDLEGAVDWLRKKGLAAAAKKAGRVAADGLIGVATKGPGGAVVEVNSETDFVARNKDFQAFVRAVSGLAVDGGGELESLLRTAYPGTGRNVEEELTHLIATIGENLVLRRVKRLAVDQGLVASYVHNALGPGIGKIGVIVALASAALNRAIWPRSASSWRCMSQRRARSISTSRRCRQRRSTASARCCASRHAPAARPRASSNGWSTGRLRKFYEEVVLLEQIFVVDQETRIAKVVEEAAKEAGAADPGDRFRPVRARRRHRAPAHRFRGRGRAPS